MRQALTVARENIRQGGRPFGAVLVREGQVISTAANEILATNDPTAHAEMLALRRASQLLRSPRLDGCIVYASGHPCPMCLAAMTMCGISAAYYGYSNEEGAPFGLSTAAVYDELSRPMEARKLKLTPLRPEGEAGLYELWKGSQP
ncbi:nucleoside deaminase [Corallococcus sp. H22C18031201]|nr:nucleoside deaminase [Citreicoccus inhibens]RJS27589.1 nucleoside deaminase [Corallococcus sp. H22C18031201]